MVVVDQMLGLRCLYRWLLVAVRGASVSWTWTGALCCRGGHTDGTETIVVAAVRVIG